MKNRSKKYSGLVPRLQGDAVRHERHLKSAFTLIELLVVIAIIAILASLLLPVLARAKAKAQGVHCLSNLKELQLCWQMYPDDNGDRLPPNKTTGIMGGAAGSWILGNAQTDLTSSNITNGVLYKYNSSVAIYHCPADKSTVTGHKSVPRTRSYSLNWYLGADAQLFPNPRIKLRYSEIGNPGPSGVFVFIDEDEGTINDGTFFAPEENWGQWGDLPGVRHSLGSNLSFADGHVQPWRWRWPKKVSGPPVNEKDKEDLEQLWLASPK